MTYRMSEKMFIELGGKISRKGNLFNKQRVVSCINLNFGLRGEVRDIVLV